VVFKDENSDAFHQIFYPNKQAMQAKIELAKKYGLGGMAIWAIGYEDSSVLSPLAGFFYKPASE
jgi:spore germination protein YaaH